MKKTVSFSKVMCLLIGISLIYHTVFAAIMFVISYTMPARKLGRMLNGFIILLLLGWFVYHYFIKKEKEMVMTVIKKYMRAENMFLLLFFVWMYVGCFRRMLIRGNTSLGGNAVILIIVAIKIFLAYMYAQYVNGNKRLIHNMFRILIGGLTVAMLFFIYQLVLNEEFLYQNGSLFLRIDLRFQEKRLYISANPNTIGMCAKTMVMLCAYMFAVTKKKTRFFYLPALIIHYIIMVMTDSRASILSAAICFGLIASIYCWDKVRKRRLAVRIAITVIAFLLTFGMVDAMRTPTIMGYKLARCWVTGEKFEWNGGKRELLKDSSGRGPIFLAAIRSMRHPDVAVFGVTKDGVFDLLTEEMGQRRYEHTHNEFLEIMCSTGIPGFLLFLTWLCMAAWCGARVFFNVKGRFTFSERILMVICLAELGNNMMEGRLTFYPHLSGMIFYLTAGYAVVFAQRLNHSGEEINNK